MKKSECEKWLCDNSKYLFSINGIGRISSISRIDDTLIIRVNTVKRVKASWHLKRSKQHVKSHKHHLKNIFPDLKFIRIVYDGSRDPVSSNGFKQFAHGIARIC